MMTETISDTEYMSSGHVGCPGCGATIAMKLALRALGENTMLVIPACCWSIIAGNYPQSALKVPVLHTGFATTAAAASGLRAALDLKGDTKTTVVGWAGDGGTFDIGFQALSGAAERCEDFIYVCYDNEAYMNTGVQRSSSTPYGARTTTTPGDSWKRSHKKNIVEAMAAHRVPYTATASIAFPDDLIRKFKKAVMQRARVSYVYASCPTAGGSVRVFREGITRLVRPTSFRFTRWKAARYTVNPSRQPPGPGRYPASGPFQASDRRPDQPDSGRVDDD